MKMSLNTALPEVTDMLLSMASEDLIPAVTEALTIAGEIAVQRLKEAADAHHGGGTGRMRDSITAGTPKVNGQGGYMDITLKGTVTKGWKYRDLGGELNYGSPRRKASGWFDDGVEIAQPEAEQAIVETLEAWIASRAEIA